MSSKREEPPFWLQAIQRFERAIGEPVETAVRSDAYFDFVAQANRARARLTRTFEELSEEWLHRFNLPAGSDVRRLREQLSRVERQLNQVAKNVADLEEAAAAPPPQPTNSRPTAARSRPTAARSRPSASKPRQTRPK
jgi:hypothetical protein